MRNFFNKHLSRMDEKIAIDMIYNELKGALDDLKEGDPEAVDEHLKIAFEMLEDYFSIKGTDGTSLQINPSQYRGLNRTIEPEARTSNPSKPGSITRRSY